ncbi:MAG: hypothetical protein LBI69_01470 [Puniceicoccales bacterium]|jgi:hypothetical protein|nr:hypothetical protein [Puniceicoccales bacterium]
MNGSERMGGGRPSVRHRVEDMDTGEVYYGSYAYDLGPYRNFNSPADDDSKINIATWLKVCPLLRDPIKKWLEDAQDRGLTLQEAEMIVHRNAEREISHIGGRNAERAQQIANPETRRNFQPETEAEENLVYAYNKIDELRAAVAEINGAIDEIKSGKMPEFSDSFREINQGEKKKKCRKSTAVDGEENSKIKKIPYELSDEAKINSVPPELRAEMAAAIAEERAAGVRLEKANERALEIRRQIAERSQRVDAEIAERSQRVDVEIAERRQRIDAEIAEKKQLAKAALAEKEQRAKAALAEKRRKADEEIAAIRQRAGADAAEIRRQAAEKKASSGCFSFWPFRGGD